MQINIHEAKTHFSKLIQRAESGEEIIIAKAGKPVVKLVAINPLAPYRLSGSAKGEIFVAEDFNAPLSDDILRDFQS